MYAEYTQPQLTFLALHPWTKGTKVFATNSDFSIYPWNPMSESLETSNLIKREVVKTRYFENYLPNNDKNNARCKCICIIIII